MSSAHSSRRDHHHHHHHHHDHHQGKGSGSGGGGGVSGGGGGQSGQKFHVVIVGEPIVSNAGVSPLGFPLSPISPSPELPYALLPIANTPLIDYILENLVENGVSDVTILFNRGSFAKVQEHLRESRTARGKPWMSSDAIDVTVVESFRDLRWLAEVVDEIKERNIVPQSGSFLFFPIDCVSFFNDLQGCYLRHLERARTIGKYAATLLCTPARERLTHTLHNVVTRALADQQAAGGNGIGGGAGGGSGGGGGGVGVGASADGVVGGGGGSSGVGGVDAASSPVAGGRALGEYARGRSYAVPTAPAEHHTMFMIDKQTGVVKYMSRLEVGDDPPELPPLITFSRKKRLSVRMDLVPTGYFFLCCEAIGLIDFRVRDTWQFFNNALLGHVEVYGNVFGVLEVPRPSAMVDPVCSLDSYIQANMDVCTRRLFPLTRESSFAEALAKYAVSSTCETVYQHVDAKILGTQQTIGPNVVVGGGVTVPATATLSGVVLGAGVRLGEGVVITNSVLMDGVVVGAGCHIRGSVIGANAVIGAGAEAVGCLIGAGCIVDDGDASGSGPLLTNQAVVCDEEAAAASDAWLVGPKGVGRGIMDRYAAGICGTAALFTEDPVPGRAAGAAASDHNGSNAGNRAEDDAHDAFLRAIRRHVEAALLQPARIEASCYDMSTACLSHELGYPDLCEAVTQMLVEHILERHGGEGADACLDAAAVLFGQWCRGFYDGFLSKNGTMLIEAMVATIEGMAVAISSPDCVLHPRAAELLEVLYNNCDDDLLDERGYCIVSPQGMIAFDAAMARRRQNLEKYAGFGRTEDSSSDDSSSDDDDDDDDDSSSDDSHLSRDLEEEGKVKVAAMCHAYIMSVKQFLEEEGEL